MLNQSFKVHTGPGLALGPYEITGNRNKPIRFITQEEAEKRYERDLYWNYGLLHREMVARDPLHNFRLLSPWIVDHLLELDGLDPKLKEALKEVSWFCQDKKDA